MSFKWPKTMPCDVEIIKDNHLNAVMRHEKVYNENDEFNRILLHIPFRIIESKSDKNIASNLFIPKGVGVSFLSKEEFETKKYAIALVQGPCEEINYKTYLPCYLFHSKTPDSL